MKPERRTARPMERLIVFSPMIVFSPTFANHMDKTNGYP